MLLPRTQIFRVKDEFAALYYCYALKYAAKKKNPTRKHLCFKGWVCLKAHGLYFLPSKQKVKSVNLIYPGTAEPENPGADVRGDA